jgi:hypothetical protein
LFPALVDRERDEEHEYFVNNASKRRSELACREFHTDPSILYVPRLVNLTGYKSPASMRGSVVSGSQETPFPLEFLEQQIFSWPPPAGLANLVRLAKAAPSAISFVPLSHGF